MNYDTCIIWPVDFQQNINLAVGYNCLLKEEVATSCIYMMNLLKNKYVRVKLFDIFFFFGLNEET